MRGKGLQGRVFPTFPPLISMEKRMEDQLKMLANIR
jgi:hypothetical protein